MQWFVLGLIPALAALAGGCGTQRSGPLVCYVGPNMVVPIQELAHLHERRSGVRVSVETADARVLIDRIVATHSADLFVTHDPFMAVLAGRGIELGQVWTVASVTPMIAVAKGNPKHIRGLEDLAWPGLRVGLTDANSISGQIIAVMLQKAGIAAKVEANVVMRTNVGRPLGDALMAGKLDACIVWNVVIFDRRDKLDAVDIRPEWRPTSGVDAVVNSAALGRLELDYVRVNIATMGYSRARDDARSFAEFVASPEGKGVFLKSGFSPADPDRPALTTIP
ncbi:MAG: substrate-binding domain-containing protein [Tepidisphaeraceae bacterium]|jgi:molybdate transport system substrate-binding protein